MIRAMIDRIGQGGPLLAPSSRVAKTGRRALMAASIPRLATRRDDASRALIRALGTAAMGRSPAGESSWVERIEERRRELISSGAIVREDVQKGPGAARDRTEERSLPVSGASLWMSLPQCWCVLLMRLTRELRPRSCVELGTGFGISGAYLAAALELNGEGRLTTFDRARGLAGIAEQGFTALGLESRVELAIGSIDDTIEDVLERNPPVDLALVDADHAEEATVRHFEAMLPFLSDPAVVIFDDIHRGNWGMGQAWRRIKDHQNVSRAIGLRRLGAVVVSRP